ncbi:histidine kinase [Amycolatopsis cynarae]|uniref:histidine kinase n=1 Tax=Amycolatopsis cynarae TaxID=2995223 RepID=A0ABY7B109_9PSEU|nr:histidine kinase [Amycolatopsis sp. HUAS 11-8]WAL65974.1 histidine kinase [Amycolatopsis sp. HUAS 11-8]
MSTRPARWFTRLASGPVLALVFTVLGFLPFTAILSATFGDLPKRPADVFAVILTLGMTLPLAIRRRWPAGSFAVIAVCFAVHESVAYPATAGTLGLLIALYSVGSLQDSHRGAVAIASTVGYAVFCFVLYLRHSPNGLADFVLFYVAALVGVGIGVLVRTRRAEEVARRRLEAEAAKAAERSRIARELHDVVTHHVTAMVVQSSATKYLTASPEQVAESLDTIGDTGRQALKELRSLLSVLEATGDQPSAGKSPALDDVPDLVAVTRNGGQPVELVEVGERTALPEAAGLTAYRVVQEALTNAVKYAGGHRTVVRIGYRTDGVDIEVASEGTTATPDRSLSGGRGLSGLRERVQGVGGELSAGSAADGVFRVRASIPTGSRA